MNAINIVAERIAELNSEINEIKCKSFSTGDDFVLEYFERKLKQLEKLKEQNETIYMVLKGFN